MRIVAFAVDHHKRSPERGEEKRWCARNLTVLTAGRRAVTEMSAVAMPTKAAASTSFIIWVLCQTPVVNCQKLNLGKLVPLGLFHSPLGWNVMAFIKDNDGFDAGKRCVGWSCNSS